MPRLRAKHHLVGVAVAIFDRRSVLFADGYGYADLATKRKVRPNETMFRAGSISKLLTWTAIMQLVERGKIHLDQDINDYLDFRIPAGPGGPITMLHLMSHTPGFEDRLMGLFYKDPARLQTLRGAVVIPPLRVRAPGQHIAYSNYGVMLAGYIVERVSGLSFDHYVERNVTGPLGMTRTTFRQPLPKAFLADAAIGYTYEKGRHLPQAFELVNGAPAGALTTTASDMVRFLQAHMNQGRGLLRPETAHLMHSRHWAVSPPANGMAHGFIEMSSGGRRMIGHGGDTIYFHALCAFLPDENLGFFIATNTSTGMPAIMEFIGDLSRRFLPGPDGEARSRAFASPSDRRIFAGEFHVTRRSESDMTKMMSLFMKVQVRAGMDRGLLVRSPFLGEKEHLYLEVAPRVFQAAEGQDQVVFTQNSHGRIDSLSHSFLPVLTFRRPPWNESALLNLVVVGGCFLLVLSGLLFRPMGLVGLLSSAFRAAWTGPARIAAAMAFLGGLSYVAFLVSVVAALPEDVIFSGAPPQWPFLFPYAALVFSLCSLIFVWPAWRSRWWSVWSRLHFTCHAIGGLMLFLFLQQWKLVA